MKIYLVTKLIIILWVAKNKIKFDDFYKSNQKFDIIISHSLFYIKNLTNLLTLRKS